MSLRQQKKIQQQQQQQMQATQQNQDASDSDAEEDEADMIVPQSTKKSGFAALLQQDDDSEDDQDSDQPEQVKTTTKKKKKKNKNKNKNKNNTQQDQQDSQTKEQVPPVKEQLSPEEVERMAEEKKQKQKAKKQAKKEAKRLQKQSEESKKIDDNQFLDQVLQESIQENEKYAALNLFNYGTSVLRMEKSNFNHKKELKQLFSQSAMESGVAALAEETKEDRQIEQANRNEQYEGASKKMKRRMLLYEKMQQKSKVVVSKKQVLAQPNAQWPRMNRLLNMKQVRVDKKTGLKVFSFEKTPEYNSLQKEFLQVQATADINMLIQFLQRNFYHHESLVYFADFLRIQGKFPEAADFLERCLFAFESSFSYDFQFVLPEKMDARDRDSFVPQTRLDMDNEPLNKVFCECLVKYIDILGRKGCCRTALEFCKLLLGLDPENDPFGVMLRIDYYAIRGKSSEYLINFLKNAPKELYPGKQHVSLLILPNFLFTSGLAIKNKPQNSESTNDLELALENLTKVSNRLEEMLDFDQGEIMIMAGLLLYPQAFEQLLRKAGKQQLNTDTRKSYFKGYQAQKWSKILTHTLFTQDDQETDFDWFLTAEESRQENSADLTDNIKNKLFDIFVERSSVLFSQDQTLLWLKEVVGFCLNKLDEGMIDRNLFCCQIASMVTSPFSLSRYMSLKKSDFTDDLTTINPNELLQGGGGGGGPANQDFNGGNEEENQAQAQAQLDQMINQLQQHNPMPPHHQQQQQQMMMPADQEQFIQQMENMDGMDEEQFEQMQAALIAQMEAANHENLQFNDDEDDDDDGQDQQNNQGGIIQGMMNMFANWGGYQQQEQQQHNQEQQQMYHQNDEHQEEGEGEEEEEDKNNQ